MKKPFSRRVVRRVTGNLFLLAASVLVLVYSCKKDITPSQTTIPLNGTAQSAAVKEAKSWFDTNAKINKQPSKTTNALNQQKWNDGLNLDWNKPDVYGKYNGTLVELPLVNSSVVFAFDRTNTNGITQQNNYTKTSFIVQKDSSGVFRGWYMVLIADTTYINGNFDKLKLNTYQSRDKDFSGRLLYYTPQGDFLAGWRYEKGIITRTLSITSNTTNTNPKQVNSKKDVNLVQYCFDRPVTTSTASCFTDPNTGMYDCTYTSTTTYVRDCYTVDNGETGGGGGSGGGGSGGGGTTFPPPPTPKPDCPPVAVASAKGPQVNVVAPPGDGGGGSGGRGTTPCNPVTVPDIKNNVKDPCLKKMVDAAVNKDVGFAVKQSMNSIFNQNTDFNIDFTDASPQSFSTVTTDGDTWVNNVGHVKNADGSNNHALDYMNVSIRLNTNLSGASKEYVTATIMHEALHAYLYYSQTIVNQHLDMARNYLNTMSSQLQSLYPNLSSADANALACGGLEKDAGSLYDGLSSLEKTRISNTNQAYKNGTTGTPCTP